MLRLSSSLNVSTKTNFLKKKSVKEKCLKRPLLLIQTYNQRQSLKLTCFNLSRWHSANQGIFLSVMNNDNNKNAHRKVITSWGRWYNKMYFKRNIEKWLFSYVQKNVITSINRNPISCALGTRHSSELCKWLRLQLLWSSCLAAKVHFTSIRMFFSQFL